MAYMKTTLISKPVQSDLGSLWDTIKGGASSAIDFFGSGLKAKGAQDALAAQLAAQQQAQQPHAGGGGISTTTMLIGGAALAGVLVFALRKK